MDYISLGKNIRKYRIQAGYTQSHLAELCDCTDGHIGQIENARSIPSLSITLSIANALNVSVDQLVSEDLTNKENFLNTRIYELTKNLSTTDKIFALEISSFLFLDKIQISLLLLQRIIEYYPLLDSIPYLILLCYGSKFYG